MRKKWRLVFSRPSHSQVICLNLIFGMLSRKIFLCQRNWEISGILWFSLSQNMKCVHFLNKTMEFFLNGAQLSLNSVNSGNLIIAEAWNGLNLKILSLACVLLVLRQHLGLLHKRWQVQVLLMTNIFVTEFSESSENI